MKNNGRNNLTNLSLRSHEVLKFVLDGKYANGIWQKKKKKRLLIIFKYMCFEISHISNQPNATKQTRATFGNTLGGVGPGIRHDYKLISSICHDRVLSALPQNVEKHPGNLLLEG